MKAPCACSFREVELNDCSHVVNGIGYCTQACIDRVGTHGRPFQYRQLAAREAATRIIGSFKDGFDVVN